MQEIEFNSTKKRNPSNIEYNSNNLAIWKCQACGRKKYLKIKERISLPKLTCSCNQQENLINKKSRQINTSPEKEAQIINKKLHTSMAEQYIFSYIKKLFPNSIRGKKFEWLGFSDFDIYIPNLQLAIEYDGKYWHKDKALTDKEKNKLAQAHNIIVFRIREEGLPLITSTDYIYINTKAKDYSNIHSAINAIIEFINKNYNLNLDYIENFNFDIHQKNTFDEMKSQKVKNSICGKWPEINEYWDYTKNGNIKPEDITISQKISLWAKCPFCHENVEFWVDYTYKFSGKEAFAPHKTCTKRNEYCLKYLEEHYYKYHNTNIIGDGLQERRVRDWIKHIIYIEPFNYELYNKLKMMGINIKI